MNTMIQRSNLKSEKSWTLLLLFLAMAATRFHHEGTAFALPDASLAVFFLAAFFLKGSLRVFLALLAWAFLIDALALTAMGVDSYCFSPAYVFLIPTYAVMWFAGNYFLKLPFKSFSCYVPALAFAIFISSTLAFLISNGSFFWFSGKVSAVSFIEYAVGLSGDYLPYTGATVFYAFFGIGMDALLRNLSNIRSSQPAKF